MDKITRNKIILERVSAGETFAAIAKDFGVTGTCVRSVFNQQKDKFYDGRGNATSIPLRTVKILTDEGFDLQKPHEIAKVTEQYLLSLPTCGKKAVSSIKYYLAEHGLELAEDSPGEPGRQRASHRSK